MKKAISILLTLTLIIGAISTTAFAAFDQTGLTMDGKSATIGQIEAITGYSFLDSNGDYVPQYYEAAKALWEKGLLLGSNGSFDLDKPITRVEGIIMALRLLGLEDEAKAANLECKFTDVPDWAKPQVAYAAQKSITSGYSATVFGSSDPMTANQYITFVLRAMGYKDGTDFQWQNAADKALAIGLIGQPCHTQYTRSNLFLRDNVAVISLNALQSAPMKTGGHLIDTISVPGKPTGTVPAAVAPIPVKPSEPAKPDVAPNINENIVVRFDNIGRTVYWAAITDGQHWGYVVEVECTVISGSGNIKITESINETNYEEHFYDVKAGDVIDCSRVFGYERVPFKSENKYVLECNGVQYVVQFDVDDYEYIYW